MKRTEEELYSNEEVLARGFQKWKLGGSASRDQEPKAKQNKEIKRGERLRHFRFIFHHWILSADVECDLRLNVNEELPIGEFMDGSKRGLDDGSKSSWEKRKPTKE
ncbi:hypothetical protein CEXT_102661 [Caerostris extrusa]|uniref:Uncharacterized protein n=1 Tax=Caerostris extrusa TaxID=172846 RepID=A0AAV4M936_CAEEX|nr:hypothetical protein CEXT_102661 [Caerostris extrusa]